MKYPKEAGIYKLTCNNGKVYIGKSINIRQRFYAYKSLNKSSMGTYIYNAILKHGWDSFTVEILETFKNFNKTKLEDRLMILDVETNYMKLFDSTNSDKGYNICEYSTDRTGIKSSEETKEKIRLSLLGRKHSEETKEKIRLGNLGNTNFRGRSHSDETKEKISQIHMGHEHSVKTKEKLRQAQLGRKHSDEHIKKVKISKTGFKHSDETKEKMRLARLGKTFPR